MYIGEGLCRGLLTKAVYDAVSRSTVLNQLGLSARVSAAEALNLPKLVRNCKRKPGQKSVRPQLSFIMCSSLYIMFYYVRFRNILGPLCYLNLISTFCRFHF